MRRAGTAVLLACLVGCGGTPLTAQEKDARCRDFAGAVAVAKLRTTPTEDLARTVASSLDNRLSRLSTADLHTPAIEVHRDLHAVEVARRRGDAQAADRAAASAREALAQLARACGLPESDFLGG